MSAKGLVMDLRYYDRVSGATRFKRRYVWAFWGFLVGLSSSVVVTAIVLR